MATPFLWEPGTGNNGLYVSALTLMSTELNSLTSASYAASSAGGSSGVFSNSNTGQALYAVPFWTFGGAFTPSGALNISAWFLESLDGSTFESATNLLARAPDMIFACSNNSYGSSNPVIAAGRIVRLPALNFKVAVQNNAGGTLPGTLNTLKIGIITPQY